MKNIILKTYKQLGDGELITAAHWIVEKMENNPGFPTPPDALTATKQLLPELQSAVSNAKGRDIEVVCGKNDKKDTLVTLLTELDDYVTLTSNGNRLMLLNSGFPISGDRYSQGVEPAIQQLEVELGIPGEATTRVKRVKRARAYTHQYTS